MLQKTKVSGETPNKLPEIFLNYKDCKITGAPCQELPPVAGNSHYEVDLGSQGGAGGNLPMAGPESRLSGPLVGVPGSALCPIVFMPLPDAAVSLKNSTLSGYTGEGHTRGIGIDGSDAL